MEELTMKVQYDEGAVELKREHETDAAYDLHTKCMLLVDSYSNQVIKTGVHVQLPKDVCAIVMGRSGLTSKGMKDSEGKRHPQCQVLPGLVDCGYTGEIGVIVKNDESCFVLDDKAPIAQLLLLRCEHPKLVMVEKLDNSVRGDQGFNS